MTYGNRYRRKPIFAGVALCVLISPSIIPSASAQLEGHLRRPPDHRVQIRSYRFEEIDEKIPYALFVPQKVKKKKKIKKAEGTKKNPLIILLHGWGAPAEAFMRGNVLDLAQDGGYIVVGPLGYSIRTAFGAPLGPAKQPIAEKYSPKGRNIFEFGEKDVLNVLEIICNEYYIDENRIYLLGISAGGAGSLYLGLKYESKWAAIAAVAPAVYNMRPVMFAPVKDTLPVILVHGDADTEVPVGLSREWARRMHEMRMKYRYIEIQGGTHVNALYAGMPDIVTFFKEHTKAGSP